MKDEGGRMKDEKRPFSLAGDVTTQIGRQISGEARKHRLRFILHPSSFILAAAAMLLLASCGFHLRGPSNIPFATMYVKGPQYSPFLVQLKRAITAGSHTKLVDDPKEAQAILDITGEQRWVQILTLTSGGRVGENTLHYTSSFRLENNKNQQFLPLTNIALHRQLTFNDAVVLAKTAEENMLYKNMQTDAVQQMVRRLEAVKVKS
jgi:LPS-assembly lipoprotein